MTNLATLTRVRIQLAIRNKMFFFFSVIMPLGFFFLYAGIFAKGDPNVVRYLMGPALSLSVMGSFWGMSAALVIYREQGILRRFHVTPVSAGEMLASSVLANYALTLPIMFVEIFFARFLFHVKDFGNLFSLVIIVTIGTMAFGAMGLVVASVTNTMQETQIINQLIWLPMIFLSGATVPLPSLPAFVQRVGVFLPATYLVSGLQKAFFLSIAPWYLRVEILSLAFWAALSFFLAATLFRWEPESKIPRNAKLWAVATIIPFLLLGAWENRYGTLQKQSRAAMQLLDRGDRQRGNQTEKPPEKPQSQTPDSSAPPQ